MQFQPVSGVCAATRVEVPVIGDEVPQDALTSWQPQLCKESGGGITFSEVSDDQARTYLSSGTPDMDMVGQAAPPSAFPARTKPVYAPLAINAVGIAFNIDWQAAYGQPDAVQALNGQRINSLKLTPLLVAKLLTQSYRIGADPTDPVVKTNPLDLSSDPEFLALNPEFKMLRLQGGLPDILTPIGSSDAVTELWQWVLGNPAARRWLAGAPDSNSDGMTVNPYFKGITAPPNYFPKNDPYCVNIPSEKPICLLDEHQYSSGLHDGARSISRGLTEATTVWNPSSIPPNWSTDPPQANGAISLLTFTDLSTADIYDLPMAALENAAGNFVTPTSATMSAALGAMTHDPATGLLLPKPERDCGRCLPADYHHVRCDSPLSAERVATRCLFHAVALCRRARPANRSDARATATRVPAAHSFAGRADPGRRQAGRGRGGRRQRRPTTTSTAVPSTTTAEAGETIGGGDHDRFCIGRPRRALRMVPHLVLIVFAVAGLPTSCSST